MTILQVYPSCFIILHKIIIQIKIIITCIILYYVFLLITYTKKLKFNISFDYFTT